MMGKYGKKIGEALVFGALYSGMRLLALLPDRALYAFSDFLAWLAGDVVKYRRRVVEQNLSSSFPEMSPAEVRRVSRRFYRFLADIFMETAKLSGLGAKGIKKRMRFEGLEELQCDFDAGKSVILFLGHYGNWEWISSMPLHLPPDVKAGQIYHPLENGGSDRAFLKVRGRFGAHSIPMRDTMRTLLGWRRDGFRSITGFIADQAPDLRSTHLWVDFLHHDTPVFTGPERLASKLRAACYYCDVEREKRGRYVCRFVRMSGDASQEPEFELTRDYFRRLEQSIRRRPELWLWSHRRWKRTRGQFEQIYGAEAGERLRHI